MFYFNIKKKAKPITREARVARLPSLGAPLHVSLENRAHNANIGKISQKMYKRPPPSPVWKDNRQPRQSATELSPILA